MKTMRFITRGFVALVVLAALTGPTAAADEKAAPAAEPKPVLKPEPGPEHKRLGYFVGKWTSSGEMKANPFGPGGKVKSQDTYEWFDGGYALVFSGEGKGPTGVTKSFGILGYDMDQKVYTYYGIDNSPMIMTSVPKGKVDNGVWTYEDETSYKGQVIKSRYIIKEESPTSFTFKWDMAGEQGWTTVMEGKSTKVGGGSKK